MKTIFYIINISIITITLYVLFNLLNKNFPIKIFRNIFIGKINEKNIYQKVFIFLILIILSNILCCYLFEQKTTLLILLYFLQINLINYIHRITSK